MQPFSAFSLLIGVLLWGYQIKGLTPSTSSSFTQSLTSSPVTFSPTSSPDTFSPTSSPVTFSPTSAPVTVSPTSAPVTVSPTGSPVPFSPTSSPVTFSPTSSPLIFSPTQVPSSSPLLRVPTKSPSIFLDGSSDDETQSPTTPPFSPPNCNTILNKAECTRVGGESKLCEWISPQVCDEDGRKCRQIEYGCQHRTFCSFSIPFRAKQQCESRPFLCQWNSTNQCESTCPNQLFPKHAIRSNCASPIALSDKHVIFTGRRELDHVGEVMAGDGDFDGDGKVDFAIGAPDMGPKQFADRDGTGGVYLYLSSLPKQQPAILLRGSILEGRFGSALLFSDVDGDGFSDLIVSAPFSNLKENTLVRAGMVYIFFGSTKSLPAVLDLDQACQSRPDVVLCFPGQSSMATFGNALSSAGDFNGDGIVDIVIGSSGASLPSRFACGQARILFGSRDRKFSRFLDISGPGAFEYWGRSISGGGDFNGDGLADVVVGSPWANSGDGLVAVVLGSQSELEMDSLDLKHHSHHPHVLFFQGEKLVRGNFGSSVLLAPQGDFNLDGIDDLVVGAPRSSANFGKVYVYFGNRDPHVALSTSPLVMGAGEELFGVSLSLVDFNGDGFMDVLVGARNTGRVLLGSCWGPLQGGFTVIQSKANNLHVGSCGDVNNDGRSDLWVGSPYGEDGKGQALMVLSCS